jgi:hypothetical protein
MTSSPPPFNPPMVISVHGILTAARWQKDVGDYLGSHSKAPQLRPRTHATLLEALLRNGHHTFIVSRNTKGRPLEDQHSALLADTRKADGYA